MKTKRNETKRGTIHRRFFFSFSLRCCREQRAMAEEREARGTRHRGATAVRAEITPVRGASQHQMVSRRDPYLHLQRGRRVNAGEQRHSRQVTCVFSDIFYIRNSARTAFFSDRAGGEALRDSPFFLLFPSSNMLLASLYSFLFS